jgi:hypothetical protein
MSSDIPLSLPPEFNILEDDIIYVVTGYNKGNSVLVSKEASIQNLRKCFLQKLEGVSGVGVSRYSIYSTSKEGNLIDLTYGTIYPYDETISTTGLNSQTANLIAIDYQAQWPYSGVIYTTGLNAIIGNNMEIQFSAGTPAANKFGGVGYKYYSGIISTTGLNARTENLIVRDFESSWPNSGVIYNTGLNAIIGNNMEIQFATGTPSSNKYGGTGGKYFSGIISTTGLNSRTENLIVRDFENVWPYSGVIYNTGLNAVIGNNIEIQFSTGTPAANRYGNVGGKYYSGIISVTGLNARTENLIVRDFENAWPYSGIIYNTGLNARAGNNIEIDFSTNRHPNMGSPYHSGTISTTGLNMIAGTGIQYRISNTWPHQYVISQLDLKAVANSIFTYGPTTSTTTVVDNQLYRDIDWSLSNSKPLIDNASSYCYIVEFFINNFTLSTASVPSPDVQGRPTTATSSGYPISWGSCNTTITPARVTVAMNGHNIINTNPSSNPTYNASNSSIYLRYIEKRNLSSNSRVQPQYTIYPAYYTRICNGTYQAWVSVPDNPSYPAGGYYYTASTSWNDSDNLATTLSLGPYRHLKLDFAELTVS